MCINDTGILHGVKEWCWEPRWAVIEVNRVWFGSVGMGSSLNPFLDMYVVGSPRGLLEEMLYSCGKHRMELRRAAGWESALLDKEEQQHFP